MSFLRRLFGSLFRSGGARSSGDPNAVYIHVRCRFCKEAIRVRLNRTSDLSPDDDSGGFVVRKSIVGQKCFRRIEVDLAFDRNYRLVSEDVTGGTMITAEEWQAEHAPAS